MYKIRLSGQRIERLQGMFPEFHVEAKEIDIINIEEIYDQSALLGVLKQLNHFGYKILGVERM